MENIISIFGTVITIIGMIITIVYANKAREYKKQIQFDIRKINLSSIVEKLKRTQDEIRKLPKTDEVKRGIKIEIIFSTIKEHFDFALNLLDTESPDNDIREFIINAQNSLHTYELEYNNKNILSEEVINITNFIQNAIAKSNTKILKIEKDL